jgi:hypothetical protein
MGLLWGEIRPGRPENRHLTSKKETEGKNMKSRTDGSTILWLQVSESSTLFNSKEKEE